MLRVPPEAALFFLTVLGELQCVVLLWGPCGLNIASYIYIFMYIAFVHSPFLPVPDESVSGLKVRRLKDDEKALIVSWEEANLTPPEGPVSLYLVEYRDAQQLLSNQVYVQPKSSSLELREVANANDYEVCQIIHICTSI